MTLKLFDLAFVGGLVFTTSEIVLDNYAIAPIEFETAQWEYSTLGFEPIATIENSSSLQLDLATIELTPEEWEYSALGFEPIFTLEASPSLQLELAAVELL
jgi:hypothetical protein